MATELWNDAKFYKSYEIIGGKKIMAPSAAPTHGGVIMRLGMIIGSHLDANNLGYVFADDVDVHFPDGSVFKPDLVVVLEKNSAIIDWRRGIFGVPDMVVEVLSKSTKKRPHDKERHLRGAKRQRVLDCRPVHEGNQRLPFARRKIFFQR